MLFRSVIIAANASLEQVNRERSQEVVQAAIAAAGQQIPQAGMVRARVGGSAANLALLGNNPGAAATRAFGGQRQ